MKSTNISRNERHQKCRTENELLSSMMSEYNQKIRNDKEKKFKESMYQTLRPKIQNEIYVTKYREIEHKVKKEIETELEEEMREKIKEEIEDKKKKEFYIRKVKEEKIEEVIREQCKEEFNQEIYKDIEKKEKEVKIKYAKMYEDYKRKIENKLKKEFDEKKKKAEKELKDIQNKMYKSKYNENIKMNRIKEIKRNIIRTHNDNLAKAERIEKMLYNKESNKFNTTECNYPIENSVQLQKEKSITIDNNINRSVNLAEINNRIKAINVKNKRTSRSFIPTHSLIQSANHLSSIQRDKKIEDSMSLAIDKSVPSDMIEYGKYLFSHIEKEEKYKIKYLSEVNQIKQQILSNFSKSKRSEHCLTDYLLLLWDKLDISYIKRYLILQNLMKSKVDMIYKVIDRETEYLTQYYQETKSIFKMIRQRELIKCKLQIMINKKEPLPSNKNGLDSITQLLRKKLKDSKYDIIWKGLTYSSFMNYEQWFYGANHINN